MIKFANQFIPFLDGIFKKQQVFSVLLEKGDCHKRTFCAGSGNGIENLIFHLENNHVCLKGYEFQPEKKKTDGVNDEGNVDDLVANAESTVDNNVDMNAVTARKNSKLN